MWRGWSSLCTMQSVILDDFHRSVHVTLHSPGSHIVSQGVGCDLLCERCLAFLCLLQVFLQDVSDTTAS